MLLMSIFRIFLLVVFYLYNGIGASFTNFKVKKYEVCNNTQRQVKYFGTVTKENGKQYLSHNITIPFPIGDNIKGLCLIQTKAAGNLFVELFTVRENNFCKAFNKYLGEFWYDIERQSQILPGVCPMREGIYHGNHILLDFEKISLQTFPFGTLRFTMEAIDKTNKNTVWCILAEVENVAN